MSFEDRARLFGDPSESLAAESVWAFRQENGDWPLFEEAVEDLAGWQGISPEEAERRLLDAIRDGLVLPTLRGGGRAWGVSLDDRTASQIARRSLDMKLPRREPEELP